MAAVREQLVEIIDILPEADQTLLLELAQRFLPDDAATSDDLRAIQKAREEFASGETIPMSEIDWE